MSEMKKGFFVRKKFTEASVYDGKGCVCFGKAYGLISPAGGSELAPGYVEETCSLLFAVALHKN